ncbi:MAG: glycosyltransferase family 39 protein [Polyangiaceae bacterium]
MNSWRAALRAAPRRSDLVAVLGLGLAARLLVVAWANGRFPPADDGSFYQVVAERIARGQGYTWAWPDGAVTYAAHYPVGYPALIGLGYALFGSAPLVAMLINCALGTLGVWACYRLCEGTGQRGPTLLGGVLAALHPSLVFYTPALMTEGVTAALLACLGWLSVRARGRSVTWLFALGVLGGLLGLVRPQALILAPVFGAISAAAGWAARLRRAVVVSALSVLACLPWTLRNCQRLDHCAFVSANGGWNLFIGSAAKATGRWVAIDELGVPDECKHEFGEAGEDRCFGRAGVENVRRAPGHFIGLIPAKLSATFDWSGAPGHYLNASNGAAFGPSQKLALGISEALVTRALVLCGILGLGLARGPRPLGRRVAALLSAVWLFRPEAWLAHLLMLLLAFRFGRALWERPNWLLGASAVLATAVTHAIFFGAGRYGLVCVLLLIPLAMEGLAVKGAPSAILPTFDSRSPSG